MRVHSACCRERDSGVCCFFFFFFMDTATTEIYTLSLHDALPIYDAKRYQQLLTSEVLGCSDGRVKRRNIFDDMVSRKDQNYRVVVPLPCHQRRHRHGRCGIPAHGFQQYRAAVLPQ